MHAFFRYLPNARVMNWIWTGTDWEDLATYHRARGSPRELIGPEQLRDPDAAALDIRPGDIILMGGGTGGASHHIAMVHSWDPATGHVFTIDGNGDGYQITPGTIDRSVGTPAPEAAAATASSGGAPPANGSRHVTHGAPRGPSVVGELRAELGGAQVHGGEAQRRYTQDEGDHHAGQIRGDGGHAGVNRYGLGRHTDLRLIGRPSLVDFEEHDYLRQRTKPHGAPSTHRPHRP